MLRRLQSGFTLIESMVSLAMLAVLMGLAVPSFKEWLQNTQIRATAEAVQAGLQLAKAEAVRRNTWTRFQFTRSLLNDCVLSASDSNWIVSLDDPSNACQSSPSDTIAPRIIQARSSDESSASLSAGQSSFVFNGFGRLTPIPVGDIGIDVYQTAVGNCLSNGGNLRCLRIVVSTGGQIHMCDPAIANANDPRAC